MLKTIITALFLLLVFIISPLLWLIFWIIGKFNPYKKDMASLRFVQGVFKVILFISGVKTTVIGLENIPIDEPVLYVGNHHGFFDTVIAYSMLPGRTGFVSKQEMQKVPIIRVWMRHLYCVFIDRSSPRAGLKSILTGIEQIKNGISVFIFPEGTRNKGDGVMPFHGGSFKLAEKTNCKIIPVTQNNTACIFEDQAPRLKKAHTVIEFGKPIDVSTLDREQKKLICDMAYDVIKETFERNKSLV